MIPYPTVMQESSAAFLSPKYSSKSKPNSVWVIYRTSLVNSLNALTQLRELIWLPVVHLSRVALFTSITSAESILLKLSTPSPTCYRRASILMTAQGVMQMNKRVDSFLWKRR